MDADEHPLLQLPAEKQRDLANLVEDDRIADVADETGYSRRQILGILATLGAGAAVGGFTVDELVDVVEAGADASDSDGNVGLPSNRVDVFADSVDATSVRTDQVNHVRYAHSPDEIGDLFAELLDGPGFGKVVLPPGTYDLTETQILPKAGGPWTLDARNCRIAGHVDGGDYFQMQQGTDHADVPFDIDIGQITIGSGDPEIALNLRGTENSWIRAKVVGRFSVGVKHAADNGSGHQNIVNVRIHDCDIGLQVGDDALDQTMDRSVYYGQITWCRDACIHIENARNNWFYAQPEVGTEGCAGYRVRCGDNTICLTHTACDVPLDIQDAERTTIDFPGFPGGPRLFHDSIVGVPPRQIDAPGVLTDERVFNVDWSQLGNTQGEVDTNKYNALVVRSADGTEGSVGYYEDASRPGGIEYWTSFLCRYSGGSDANREVRVGLHADSSNHVEFYGNSTHATDNWHVRTVENGTETNDIDTGVTVDKAILILEGTDDDQRWFIDGSLVARTSVSYRDTSVVMKPRLAVEALAGAAGQRRARTTRWETASNS